MSFSKEEKAMWLEDWKQSGKKAWTYAKDNGLIPQTFSRWIKGEGKQASSFVEIPARKKPKPEAPQGILIEKGDIRIHISLGVWAEGAALIMEGLRATL